jgi:hypothetical protein
MQRVFTINVLYNGKFHLAEVSFDPEEVNRSFLVRYLDKEINDLIHQEKILINFTKEQTQANLKIVGEELLVNTKEAINTYLYQYQD